MSGFYSAGQYDDSFKPIRLRNYSYGTNPWPGKYAICSPLCRPPLEFIANDCGHLLPCVCANPCTSPWGDYATSIWEQTKPCLCIQMLRHPENFIPRKLIYITKPVPDADKFASEAAAEYNDPCTKEGMMEDLFCERDASCPGGRSAHCRRNPFGLKLKMVGDKKAVVAALREERRAEKRALMNGRGRRKGTKGGVSCPQVINLRFAVGCGDAANLAYPNKRM